MVDISTRAANFIVGQEVSSKAYYDENYQHFDWPGGSSGPTVGIGYDLGYVTHAECVNDWTGILGVQQTSILLGAIGLTGESAHMWVSANHDAVTITWAQAIQEFNDSEIPKWENRTRKALPNFDLLSPDSAGALVSLAYNRGAGGFHSTLPRYAEMANIHDLMAQGRWELIPQQIASMVRLWPTVPGLQVRRRLEAKMFADGVRDCKPYNPLVADAAAMRDRTMPANQTEQPAHPAATPQEPSVTMTPQTPSLLSEIETALQVAETELPTLISVLGIFIPQLKALTPFLSLLPVAIQAVNTVSEATGGTTTHSAVAQVVQTLTPGQPGAPALN